MKRLPRLMLLGTGGTIASTASGATVLSEYSVTETIDTLLAGVPGITDIARIDYEQVFNVDSREITNDKLLLLAGRINTLLARRDVDGVVVTHGTDTMEETAYFLHLTVRSPKPVVLVGAMRPASALSADGPLNLYNGVLLAADRGARGRGVMVMLNDQIHCARFVGKMNTTRVEAFGAPDQGSLGVICGGRAHWFQSPLRPHTKDTDFDITGLEALPAVDIVYDHQSAGLHQYRASIRAGVEGIVVAGSGNGSLSPNAEKGAALAAKRGIVCVRGTRVPAGMVTSREDDASMGMVAAGFLNPQKARILLMLALTRTADIGRIQADFDKY